MNFNVIFTPVVAAATDWVTPITFLAFTALVGVLTYCLTRNDNRTTNDGFFLGGRSLTFPVIAGSLLLTNLSTEQMVGLNGDAFTLRFWSVMAWEVVAVVALCLWRSFPAALSANRHHDGAGYLKQRFDRSTGSIANFIFLAPTCHSAAIILYTARRVDQLLDIRTPGRLKIIWFCSMDRGGDRIIGALRVFAV